MMRSVAVLVLDRVSPFELGVLCETFGMDRTADGFPGYDFAVCAPGGKPVRTASGFSLTPTDDLAPLETADLVAVPAMPLREVSEQILAALRRAADRGAYVMSVCRGAFLLGAAGLLDGRRCTTHWRYADDLARQYPLAKVDPNVLYVSDDNIHTSAGTAAGIDLCLHLVRTAHGSAVANALARRMVVPPHRDGGQAQFVERPLAPVPQAPTLDPLLTWVVAHLEQPITVESLAARAHMAPRTFARRFRAETGATPHEWIVGQRILLARQLLEETALTVDAVALRAGFSTAAALRHHFGRRMHTTPHGYRASFQTRPA